MGEDKPEGVAFNMAALFYQELSEIRQMKSRFYMEGDMRGYRDALEEIFTMISFKLSDKETSRLIDLMNEAQKLFNSNNLRAKSVYRQADMLTMEFMNRYGMILPNNKTAGGLPEIRKRYGLEGAKP